MDFFIISQNKTFFDYPSHSHDLWEILLNTEGSGTAIIDGKIYPFSPGTIFCIRPGTMHQKRAESGFKDSSILLTDFCFKQEPENVFVFQDDEQHSLFSLYQVAYQYSKNPETDLFAERFLRSILDAIQNLLSQWKYSNIKNPEVLRIQKVLSEHVGDHNFCLDSLLETSAYSPNYLRALFKEQLGVSPLQYYHQLIVMKAKQLLLQQKNILSVSQIAWECGIEDPYYFSRLFKKQEGCSPVQFYKRSKALLEAPIPQEDQKRM